MTWPMKKYILPILALMFTLSACADDVVSIQADQLPAKSQKIIEKCFEGKMIESCKLEKRASLTQYEVVFVNGDKLQFAKNGNCTEVKCKKHAVPDMLVPSRIREYMGNYYPEREIRSIEHDSKLYEVILDDKAELTFNSSFRLISLEK